MRLQDKVALVTGAAGGIGLAIARRFVAEGAYVLLADRKEAELTAAARSLGERAAAMVADVTDPADARTLRLIARRTWRFLPSTMASSSHALRSLRSTTRTKAGCVRPSSSGTPWRSRSIFSGVISPFTLTR